MEEHPPRSPVVGAEPTRGAVAAQVFALLAHRQPGRTICPSEVARAMAPENDRWRALMPLVRDVAGELAQAGRLKVTRAGVEVDATASGGPIRLGL